MIYSISRAALLHELERLHMASGAVDILQRKSEIIPFKLTDVRTPAGNIIKQEMLAAGGDCATPFGSITCSTEVEDIVLLGTEKHYRRLMDKLKLMPYFGLAEISEELKSALSRQQKRTVLSDGRAITYDRCLVMVQWRQLGVCLKMVLICLTSEASLQDLGRSPYPWIQRLSAWFLS